MHEIGNSHHLKPQCVSQKMVTSWLASIFISHEWLRSKTRYLCKRKSSLFEGSLGCHLFYRNEVWNHAMSEEWPRGGEIPHLNKDRFSFCGLRCAQCRNRLLWEPRGRVCHLLSFLIAIRIVKDYLRIILPWAPLYTKCSLHKQD